MVNEKNKVDEEKKSNKKKMLIIFLLILFLITGTLMVTYSFFDYTKDGEDDNIITTGVLKFLYTENMSVGNGVSITNATPVSDETGKSYTTDGYVFDFKVTASLKKNKQIPYEITAQMKKESNLDPTIVKTYLTKVSNDEEVATPLTIDQTGKVKRFSELTSTTLKTINTPSANVEKTIYHGTASGNDYEQNFRFRMWVSNDTDFTGVEQPDGTIVYPYSGKKFIVTINVYSSPEN